MPRSYALGERFEAFIKAQVEDVRRSIEEGREHSALVPADEVFDRLEAKYRVMAERDARHWAVTRQGATRGRRDGIADVYHGDVSCRWDNRRSRLPEIRTALKTIQ